MLRTLTTAVLGATAMTVTTILPAQAAEEYRGHWALDDPSASTASDSSGFGNTGLGIGTTPAPTGGGFTFDGISARVIVADSPTLDPGAEDTSWGVTLEMTRPPAADETYDVLRKGLATTKGGDYKLEVKNVKGKAIARCTARVFRAGAKPLNGAIQSQASAAANLATGGRHTVTCTKTPNGLTIKVDELATRAKAITYGVGTISNANDLALGAKAEGTAPTGFDWFEGSIYDAWVRVGQAESQP